MKMCSSCKRVLPLSEFHRDKSSEDGRGIYCRPCNNDRHAVWRSKNTERIRENARARREAGKELIAERARNKYWSDPAFRAREQVRAREYYHRKVANK